MMTTQTDIIPEPEQEERRDLLMRQAAQSVPEGENPDVFTPDTAEKVDWVLGKIADARARAARIRENAEKLAKAQEADADFLLFRYEFALREFCQSQTEGTKRKSCRFLNGVMGYRTKPATVAITDEREVRAWAETNLPRSLRVDPRILSAHVLETGEVVEGTKINPAEEVFYVK